MTIDVYVEARKKRVFAGAIEWPGWSRSERTEDDALEALHAYARRYGRALGRRKLGFAVPSSAAELTVSERLRGDATTDFGAPAIAPQADARPMRDADLERAQSILRAAGPRSIARRRQRGARPSPPGRAAVGGRCRRSSSMCSARTRRTST